MTQAVWFQRVEALALFAASLYFYWDLHFSFVWFVALFLVFDVFMLGYALNKKLGAVVYNLGHSVLLPCLLLIIGAVTDNRTAIGLSLIWFAHIGMDRALGYGLKLASGFKHTHLGDIGK